MNNTTTKTLPLFAIFIAAILIVVVAIQPTNAIGKEYSESTSTICINDTPCVTKICINNEPCNNTLTSSPTNTDRNTLTSSPTNTDRNTLTSSPTNTDRNLTNYNNNNNNNDNHTLFSLFPQENK
jgi:hypothetical protein